MSIIRDHLRILVLSCSLLLAACGGGALLLASGGIGGTGISLGPILLFGSVKVNGVTFETTNADVVVEGVTVGNGDADVASMLALGQVVRVEGTINDDGVTGTANRVIFNDNIEGPVEAVTPIDTNSINTATIAQITVMGQTIIVDDRTEIVGTTLIDLDARINNVMVEVSGLPNANGDIHALYLKKTFDSFISDVADVEFKGVIDTGSVDTLNTKFTVNGLLVDYLNANYDDLLTANPVAGTYVEIKGTYNLAATRLDASLITREDELDANDDDKFEIESIVTSTSSFIAPQTIVFFLGQQEVHTDNTTIFKGGIPANVVVGTRLEAEGTMQSGVLIAKEIEFEDGVELEARVATSSFNAGTNTMTLTLAGITSVDVLVNSLTDIDVGGGTVSELNNALINGNTPDYVEIRGRLNASNQVIASEIKVDDGSGETKVKLQGPIEDTTVTEPVFTVLGITINVDSEGIVDFEGSDDQSITRSEFFSTVKKGNIVSIDGDLIGGTTVDWDQVELENDE